MLVAALQLQSEPKGRPRSAQWCQIGQHGPWQTVVPVPRAIASSFRVALQIAFRNKIPVAHVLRRPGLITSFGYGAVQKLTAVSRSGDSLSSGSSPAVALVRMRHGARCW